MTRRKRRLGPIFSTVIQVGTLVYLLVYLPSGLKAALLIIVGIGIFFVISDELQIFRYRRQGIYPLRGQVTEQSIYDLLKQGHRVLAIRAYQELYDVNFKAAKLAVDKIERMRLI